MPIGIPNTVARTSAINPFDQNDRHRAAETDRLAEVPLQHVAHIDHELDWDGFIEAVFGVEAITIRLGHFLPQHRPAWVAGDHARDRKRHHQDAKNYGYCQDQTSDSVLNHKI